MISWVMNQPPLRSVHTRQEVTVSTPDAVQICIVPHFVCALNERTFEPGAMKFLE